MELTPFHGPPASVPQIPGIAARTLLGFGAHGEVWLADDLTTGLPVAVKVGRRAGGETGDIGDTATVAGETTLLSRIRHPHVLRLHRVVNLPDGELALVLDLAAGGSLASLVAARGRLEPGEVSTLLIPLADALQHLHARGVVHGDISPGNVLFSDDGRPQLGDLGVGRLLGARADELWSTPGFTDPAVRAGSAADPRAADLWSLAAVGWFALTGHPPPSTAGGDDDETTTAGELLEVLKRYLTVDVARRPPAAQLADQAWEAARPAPVRLVTEVAMLGLGAGLPPLSSRVTRRVEPAPGAVAPVTAAPGPPPSHRRWKVAVAVAGAGLTLAALSWVLVPRMTGEAPPPAAAPARSAHLPLEQELGAALGRIGRARATAFSTLSVSALGAADLPGSPADRSDRALVGRLRAAGYRLQGVTYHVTDVRVLSRESTSAVVRASVTTSSHRRVGSGRAEASVPVDGPRTVTFTLVARGAPSDGDWRVSDVGPAT